MSGWLDNVNCSCCECECATDVAAKRNMISPAVAGTLFFVGWWLYIDAMVAVDSSNYHLAFMTCGIVSTLAFAMITAVSNAQVRGEASTDGSFGQTAARIWLLTGFFLAFGSLIGACYILFGPYVTDKDYDEIWPGIAVFLQNLFIFSAAMVFKFGRTEENWD